MERVEAGSEVSGLAAVGHGVGEKAIGCKGKSVISKGPLSLGLVN